MIFLKPPHKYSLTLCHALHVGLSERAFDCIYAFLLRFHRSSKTLSLKDLLKLLLDFQQATNKVLQKNFPESHLFGCFFNFLKMQ